MTDPASGCEYLSLEDLLDLVSALGAGPVRDLGLLDSACHRPRASFFGQEAYPVLAAKAAALMHSPACNHALADGNKRLALLATAVFLRVNGYYLDLADEEAFDLTFTERGCGVTTRQLLPSEIEFQRVARFPHPGFDPTTGSVGIHEHPSPPHGHDLIWP